MTDISEQVRGVLEDLSEDIEMAKNEWLIENAIIQALIQIDTLYRQKFEEMLPEEVTEYNPPTFTSSKLIKDEAYVKGFNACLQEIRRRMG